MTTRSKKSAGMAELPALPGSLKKLAKEAEHCRNCDLWRNATQTVFGEGDPHATIMLVGEQPGDQEDLQGKLFVGPAGKLLRNMLEEAEIDLKKVYLTNPVKHFKFEPRGKRRIHKKPSGGEIAELKPKLIVCLGATAAQALLGRGVSRHTASWRITGIISGAIRDGDRAPIVDFASA